MGTLLLAVISRLGSSLQLWMQAHTHAHAFCSEILKASLCVYITSSPFILRLETWGVQPLCKYVNEQLVPWLNDKCIHWLHLEGWTEPLITFQIPQKDLTVKHKQHFLILCCFFLFFSIFSPNRLLTHSHLHLGWILHGRLEALWPNSLKSHWKQEQRPTHQWHYKPNHSAP